MRSRICLFLMIFSVWTHGAAKDAEVLCDHMESCVLPCEFEAGPGTIVNWFKNPGSILVYSSFQPDLVDADYKGRTSLSEELTRRNASLLLKEVRVHDEGTYVCLVAQGSEAIPIQTLNVQLRVRAPVLQVSLSQEGQQLVCRSEGIYPKPVVTWTPSTENNTRVPQSELGLFSVFSSVALPESEKKYICNISSEFGWRSATYWENPQISFSDAKVTVPCTEPTAPVKSLVWKFNCETILTRSRSEPVYSEFWKPFGIHLESNSLVLKDLTRNQQGLFSCELSTESEEFSINTQLTKAQPPGGSAARCQ